MRSSMIYLLEIIIGAFVLAFGITYLAEQVKVIDHLVNNIGEQVLENRDIYQQAGDDNINIISDEELIATVIGYREFPMILNGKLIEPDGTEYERYVSYIRDHFYIKRYMYDVNDQIIQVVFSPAVS